MEGSDPIARPSSRAGRAGDGQLIRLASYMRRHAHAGTGQAILVGTCGPFAQGQALVITRKQAGQPRTSAEPGGHATNPVASQAWQAPDVTDPGPASQIAAQLDCPPSTVYRWLHRFNEHGIDGLGGLPAPAGPDAWRAGPRTGRRAGPQRPARAAGPPADGSLEAADAQASAHWTLDALAHAAQAKGIKAGRSQVRRILQADGVRWRTVRSWSTSGGQEFAPNKRRLAGWCCAVGCTTAPAAATLRVAASAVSGPFRSGSVIAPMPSGPNFAEHGGATSGPSLDTTKPRDKRRTEHGNDQ
jgi:transposase